MSTRAVAWSAEDERALARVLEVANGRRQVRRLTLAQVRGCAEAALASPEGYAWCHGGEVDDGRALTTVCLAVATPVGVTVGVKSAHAQGVTPAWAWADLKTWDRHHAPANVAECRAWAGRARDDRVRLALTVPERAPAPIDDALLAAVLEAPADDRPRLVLADLWSERGDPRGELVALQLERESLAPGEARAEALSAREVELLAQHGAQWLGPARDVARVSFRRGFVEAVELLDAAGLAAAAALLDREPVTRLTVATPTRVDCLRLAQAPWLARLERLAFESPRTGSGRLGLSGLQQLLSSPGLRELRALRCVHQGLGDAGLSLLAREGGAVLPGLRELQVAHDSITARGVEALFATKWGARLEHLTLSHQPLGPAGAAALVARHGAPRLRHLELDADALGDEGAVALAACPRLATLRHLSLAANGLTRAGLEALLDSPHLSGLETLSLAGNWLGSSGRRLLQSRFPASRLA